MGLPSICSEFVDKGEAVFLLLGDLHPSGGTFLAFGELVLRTCDAFVCVFVDNFAAACFFGDSLNSLLASDDILKEGRVNLATCGIIEWV